MPTLTTVEPDVVDDVDDLAVHLAACTCDECQPDRVHDDACEAA